ncbi:mannose-1-phosphate guanylyltransferase [Lysinibacter cavernae]|uniref:Mannose-1-phosphate guanylyltransferase n=1 Tax=Lysinibacter cavernae TaxID=1640652 RepID=A0A7X5R3Y1_9MICO|nr:mannose-1-phosphate guanylyltransferase [Lysinibacter cavernae]NIH55171.1 mannose-1-phosphate guanylyltransferase [Lysinibacter cavernae]
MVTSARSIDRFYSIIPAGGVGSRLWPLSRADAPKFLLDLTGSGQSLLSDTWDRVYSLAGPERVMVVTGRSHRSAVCEQLPDLGDHNLVLESQPKDSSAAIGLAAAILEHREPDVIVGSFAADHVIRGQLLFHRAVAEAAALADTGRIVTIGIAPTEPSVGFGYIHAGEPIESLGGRDSYEVRSFVEKPDLETATSYVESGEYLWNAGMFISRADVLLDQMAKSDPELVANLREMAAVWDTPERDATVDRLWDKLPKVAIDYTVAEPAAERGAMACVAAHFEWDDVGDFASVSKLLSRGRPNDLAVLGQGARILSDASNGIVVAQSGRLISLIGLQDIVVVDTPDVLLVTTKENAQKVKSVVDLVKRSGESTVL